MVFIQKWSISLLLLLFVCMAYTPIMAAMSCFFLGLALQIHQPTLFKFDKNDLYRLFMALIGLLLIGVLSSIDTIQSRRYR